MQCLQLEKNYGKEGAEIIIDNTQLTISGGFAPNSTSADVISKALGTRTVLSGSVSRSKENPSQSLQMIERPLMTADELRNLPKGMFIVMKTGFHPMKVHMKLFFKWGITFDEDNPYVVSEHASRKVEYSCRDDIKRAINDKYHKNIGAAETEDSKNSGGQKHDPKNPPVEVFTGPPENRERYAKYMTMKEGKNND